MDLILLIIIIAVAVLVLGGTAFAFLRGRGDHTPTLDPSATDKADSILTKPQPAAERGEVTVEGKAADPVAVEGTAVDGTAVDEDLVDDEMVEEVEEVEPEPQPATFRERLGKARSAMTGYLSSILSGLSLIHI